jgi:hypothetical protein
MFYACGRCVKKCSPHRPAPFKVAKAELVRIELEGFEYFETEAAKQLCRDILRIAEGRS